MSRSTACPEPPRSPRWELSVLPSSRRSSVPVSRTRTSKRSTSTGRTSEPSTNASTQTSGVPTRESSTTKCPEVNTRTSCSSLSNSVSLDNGSKSSRLTSTRTISYVAISSSVSGAAANLALSLRSAVTLSRLLPHRRLSVTSLNSSSRTSFRSKMFSTKPISLTSPRRMFSSSSQLHISLTVSCYSLGSSSSSKVTSVNPLVDSPSLSEPRSSVTRSVSMVVPVPT